MILNVLGTREGILWGNQNLSQPIGKIAGAPVSRNLRAPFLFSISCVESTSAARQSSQLCQSKQVLCHTCGTVPHNSSQRLEAASSKAVCVPFFASPHPATNRLHALSSSGSMNLEWQDSCVARKIRVGCEDRPLPLDRDGTQKDIYN